MKNIIIAILALVLIALIFFTVCIVVSAIRYLHGEMIHTVRNMKRSAREFMWGIEWDLKHR